MRLWVPSLTSLRGLRIQRCRELWCRPAAVGPIQPLAWELPYAVGAALKKKKTKTQKTGSRFVPLIGQKGDTCKNVGWGVGGRIWCLAPLIWKKKTFKNCLVIQFLHCLIFNPFFPPFLGLHSQHMGVTRLGVELELYLLAYATATSTPNPSYVCNLHHSSWQHQILINPLSEARDRTRNFMVPSQIH